MDLETIHTNAAAKLPLLKQENGNSFKPTARTTTNADGTSTSMIPGAVTTEEKTQKKNDVKARSMLLMALPNEHLLTFNQYKDAKALFDAIQTRFGGNDATKKTQKTLLKQRYENFNAPSTESLDSIFNRIQKIISQLAILGENISQEDLNLMFSRSLPFEWNTHVVVWRNKPDLDTMSFDDLYTNFKIVEQERIGKKITINGSDIAGYDKSKVECFNCHKMGHFARECKSLRNQESRPRNHDNGNRNQDSSRRTVNVEETSSKAIVAIDGADSEVYNDKTCSNTCLKSFETLKTQLDNLRVEFNKSEFNLATYKRGLIFTLPIIDLSNSGLEEFQHHEFKSYGPKASKSVCVDTSNEVKKTYDTPLVEELVSEKEKQTVFPTKIEFVKQQDKTARKPVKVNYNYTTNRTHPNAQRNMVPRAGLMKTGLKPFKTARTVNTALPKSTVFSAKPIQKVNTAKTQAVNIARPKAVNTARPNSAVVNTVRANQANAVKASACWGNPPTDDQGNVDCGCSRHMTGNISYLSDFQEFDGGYVTFGGGVRGGKITGKGTHKTGKLDFQDVYFVKELQFNLFSVSQMCDKKNCVLFTDTACFVLSPDFKLQDESQILLKIPRKNNIYSVDMKNIVPKESLTCLVSKATLDEPMLWHMRLGHVNFKTINILVNDNLVRGLPLKHFENDQTCVACLKGKQHKALSSKDETSGILKIFITKIENIADKKVKIIRCDNGTEFKNRVMNEFYEKKGIKRESSNRIIIVKPYNKTPYELFRGRTPALSFMRPFGCHVSILNTLDHLGKFDGKSDDGYFVGYSLTSKAFRVYNIRTKRVEENLHIRFLEDKPIVSGDGPKWLFDLDSLAKSMNYVPIIAGTNSNDFPSSEVSIGEGSTSKETSTSRDYIVMPLWKDSSLIDSPSMNVSHDAPEHSCDAKKKDDEGVSKESRVDDQ
ncbi:ribonuclease H-like domain-containing protein [Tanacetum coccineum]